MPLIELSMIISAIVEMTTEAGWDKLRKHQAVQQVLRNLGVDFDPSSAEFDDVYTYTLVSFGMGKPRPIIEIFCQLPIRQLLRRVFTTGDRKLVQEEARELIDWPVLEELLVEFDISPEPLMQEFLDCFEDAVDRARTAVEVRHERKIDELIGGQEQLSQQISQQLSPQLEEIKTLLLQESSIEDAQLERISKEKAYNRQIDQARDLIQEDKAGAAQSLLKKLEVELQDRDISTGLRFRLLTNMGASFLLLGDDAQAASYFERALDYAPNDPKALSNAALAAFIREDFGLAIKLTEQALSIQSDHPSALSVWVQALAKTNKLDQLDQGKRASIERNVESRRALAFVLIDVGEYEQAEKLLRLSVESDESDPQDLALLAQAILAPIHIGWWENPPLPWDISSDKIARLEEAEALLTQVIDAWALIENRRRFHSVLALRLNARALQSKFELAAQDCQRILGEDPTHPQALYNNGLLALDMESYAEAIKYFQRCLINPLQQESTRLPLAVAYLKNGQPRDALELLLQEEGNEAEQEMSVQLEKLILIAQAAQTLGETAQLSEVMEQLCALPQDDPLVLEALASVELIQQRANDAIEHLQQALEFAEGNLKNRLTLQLAEIYYRQRQFDKAIPLYETVVPTDRDSPPTRDYAVSLLNSGNWNQAYDLARKIRSGGDAIPVISEVEARIAESIGDFEPALLLYMELAKLEPDNPAHFLRVASIHIRSGKPERAATSLDPVVKRFWDDPHALIGIARVFAIADCPASDTLSLAYRARRLGIGDPEIHLAYIYLFMKVEDDPSLDLRPSEVSLGSSVQLTSERETLWYTILEEEPIDRDRRELAPNDPVAQKLLGHKVGETVELKESPYEQLVYKIIEIQSKYVHAYQETFLNFSTWFPEHLGLHRCEVVDSDFSKVFQVTDMLLRQQTAMYELYATRQLTLEGYAQSISRSIAAAWGRSIRDNRVIASVGTLREQEYHRQGLESSTSVTVDLLALFTLTYLNQLNVLTERFQRVYVSQASIDVLEEDIQRLRQFPREHGSIGREGERYIVATVPKEVTVHDIQFLEGVQAFARESCQIMPTTRALELGRERFEQCAFVLGRSSISSVLVAKETGSLLYSDDFLLRLVAEHDFSVAGVWTQPVLLDACAQGMLTVEDYCGSVVALALANYYYVPLNVLVLMHVLRENQWVIRSQVEKVFAPLGSADTNTQDAVRIIAELVHNVWTEPISNFHRQQILDLCLRTLTANRDSLMVLPKLQIALREQFTVPLQHQLKQVNREIKRWLQVHGIS